MTRHATYRLVATGASGLVLTIILTGGWYTQTPAQPPNTDSAGAPCDETTVAELIERLRDYWSGSPANFGPMHPDVGIARKIAGAGSKALPSLYAALREKDEYRVEDAAFCLGSIGAEESVKSLVDAGRRGAEEYIWPANPWLKITICWALGQIGSDQAVPFLLDLLENAPPQVDEDRPSENPRYILRRAAALALEEITGRSYSYRGQEAFATPSALPRYPLVLSGAQLECWETESRQRTVTPLDHWEIEGGKWEVTPEGIVGTAEDTGRLWLKHKLPTKYTFMTYVTIEEGTAGFSYGHLKDFRADRGQLYSTDLHIFVTESDLCVSDCRGQSSSCIAHHPSWRNCAVNSRADLGNEIALFVSNGRAVFEDIHLDY